MLVARCAAAFGLLAVVGGGCSEGGAACPGSCGLGNAVEFDLSCDPADITNIPLSGGCAKGDANPANYVCGKHDCICVGSPIPGVCHVELTFATGFIYSADVTFTSQPGDPGGPGCPPCPSYIAPTQGKFVVNNPSTTCIDAGADADAAD